MVIHNNPYFISTSYSSTAICSEICYHEPVVNSLPPLDLV